MAQGVVFEICETFKLLIASYMRYLEVQAAAKVRDEFVTGLTIATLNDDVERARELLAPFLDTKPDAAASLVTATPDEADAPAADGEQEDVEHPWEFVDCYGWTPLHWAAARGFVSLARVLLDASANIDAPHPHDSRTPLHRAAETGRAEAVELLLASGASRTATSIDGDCALHYAAAGGFTPIVRALLAQAGASRDPRNRAGITPLARAAAQLRDEACAALIEAGADAGAPDENGWRPLHHAAAHADVHAAAATCERLLRAGADPYALTAGKRSALDVQRGGERARSVLAEAFARVANELAAAQQSATS